MSLILNGTTGISDVDGTAAAPALTGTDTNTGIFFPAADTIAFAEGGAEAVRIDASGNVGIATSSPGAKLDVVGNIQARTASDGGLFLTTAVADARSATIQFYKSRGSYASPTDVVNGDSVSQILSLAYSGTQYRERVSIESAIDGTFTSNQQPPLRLGFYTNVANGAATERARIDSSGNLLVGVTSAISVAGVSGTNSVSTSTANRWAMSVQHTDSSTPWGVAVQYSGGSPNNTTQQFIYCYDSAPAQRFSVRSNGGIANYSANDVNLSDRREKTNFASAKSYLDVICAIPVQTFNYIDQNMEEDGGLTLGVVAQDVQAVAPEMVMESNWGTEEEPKMRLSIYQTDLQYALMKCIQEQQALITALTTRITALEGVA